MQHASVGTSTAWCRKGSWMVGSYPSSPAVCRSSRHAGPHSAWWPPPVAQPCRTACYQKTTQPQPQCKWACLGPSSHTASACPCQPRVLFTERGQTRRWRCAAAGAHHITMTASHPPTQQQQPQHPATHARMHVLTRAFESMHPSGACLVLTSAGSAPVRP